MLKAFCSCLFMALSVCVLLVASQQAKASAGRIANQSASAVAAHDTVLHHPRRAD